MLYRGTVRWEFLGTVPRSGWNGHSQQLVIRISVVTDVPCDGDSLQSDFRHFVTFVRFTAVNIRLSEFVTLL